MKIFKSNFQATKSWENHLGSKMKNQLQKYDKTNIHKSLYQVTGKQEKKYYVLLDAGSKVEGAEAKELTLRKTYELAKDIIEKEEAPKLFNPLIKTERAKYSKGFHGTFSEFVSKLKNLIFRPEHKFKSTADFAKTLVDQHKKTPGKLTRGKVAFKRHANKIVALDDIKKKYGSDAKSIMKAVLKGGKVESFKHVKGKKKDTFRFVMDSVMEGKGTLDNNTYIVTRAEEVVVEFIKEGNELKINFLKKCLQMKPEKGWDKVLPEGASGFIRIFAKKFKSYKVLISSITIDKREQINDNERVKLWIKHPITREPLDALTGSTDGLVNLFKSVKK